MSAPSSGGGGRSRRLGALSLDDDGTSGVIEKRADKTVPLAVYGGTTGQGQTPLAPAARPSLASGNVGTTTAPLPAQSAPPAISTPVPPSAHAVSAAPTPSAPGTTGTRGAIDKGDDDVEGPPLSKTPWVAIGVVGIVVVIIGVVAVVMLGGRSLGALRFPHARRLPHARRRHVTVIIQGSALGPAGGSAPDRGQRELRSSLWTPAVGGWGEGRTGPPSPPNPEAPPPD